ncbi:cysteine desulfurase NifS [Methanocella sp. CWC-04]|uniref:Cysteine desulfurase IscS n=1 Tax=Methanooceanicella nereidis TaxID=2052831 RepID=A0AAP2RA23_9EURY|nr:cysteine desulfurase NifS [Methanocella sp. CWC-04]MCD1293704.1 cysteine desulfurase NifS [Methanocella sp. CWC-04]
MDRIYLDNSATTRVSEEVMEAMMPYFHKKFGNASSLHTSGREAREAVEKARQQVAGALGADTKEIVFTSGGTESDNLAIIGVARAYCTKGNHIITSSIEHSAVYETCHHLEKQGFKVTYVPVDSDGIIKAEELKAAIRPETTLITVMHINNEIGTIQPLEDISEIAKENEIIVHTDAVQSLGKVNVDVDELGIDLLSISGHKLHGPKGIGALFIRKGTKIKSQSFGGGQERGLRCGTENVPGIVGLGQACESAARNLDGNSAKMRRLRDRLISGALKIDKVRLNGHPAKRSPNNANLSFSFVEGESLLLMLDMNGIDVSTGSACSSKELEPSHVLIAMGLSPEEAHGSIRFTNSHYNTDREIDYVLEKLPEIVAKLREMSPLYRPAAR